MRVDGELRLSMMNRSTQAQDLRRDPRILVHSITTGPAGADEIKLRGRANENRRGPEVRADSLSLRWCFLQ